MLKLLSIKHILESWWLQLHTNWWDPCNHNKFIYDLSGLKRKVEIKRGKICKKSRLTPPDSLTLFFSLAKVIIWIQIVSDRRMKYTCGLWDELENSALVSIFASSTDLNLKRIQTPHSLFCGLGAYKPVFRLQKLFESELEPSPVDHLAKLESWWQVQTQGIFELAAVAAGSDKLALGRSAATLAILTQFEMQFFLNAL